MKGLSLKTKRMIRKSYVVVINKQEAKDWLPYAAYAFTHGYEITTDNEDKIILKKKLGFANLKEKEHLYFDNAVMVSLFDKETK